MSLTLLQDLSLFVNEVKRDNEMLHSLSMVEKRYIDISGFLNIFGSCSVVISVEVIGAALSSSAVYCLI